MMSEFPEINPGIGLLDESYANSIAQVNSTFGYLGDSFTKPGTAWLIRRKEGKCYLATAAHMLWQRNYGFPQKISVKIGLDGSSSSSNYEFGNDVAERCFVPEDFLRSGDLAGHADIGLIRLDNDLGGTSAFSVSSVLPVGDSAKLIGYPQGHGDQSDRLFHVNIELVENGDRNFDYAHQVTYPGMSGGPLVGISSTDTKPRVFGLHIRRNTSMRAIRFHADVRSQLRNWIDRQ